MPKTPHALPWLLLLLLPLGCTHSDPFPRDNYGAVGPYGKPEGRLTGIVDASWSENGGGILYVGQCFSRNATPHATIPSIIVLPAEGGSAILDRCEQPITFRLPTALDSTVRLLSPALGGDGRLIYVEAVSNNENKPLPCSCIPFPIATHAEMWLTDSASPFSRRRKLLTLYHDSVGRPTVPDDQVNWLTEAVWAGQNTFIALGQNVRPNEAGRTAGPLLAMVRGTIGPASASLASIAGTDRARMFSLAEGNATIVFNRDALVLERVPSAGGTPTVAVVLPALAGRSLQDVSCKGELCLIVTQEPGTGNITPPTIPGSNNQSTYWMLTLNSGALTVLRTVPVAISRARISPTSNSVVVLQSGGGNGGLYLLTDLLQ